MQSNPPQRSYNPIRNIYTPPNCPFNLLYSLNYLSAIFENTWCHAYQLPPYNQGGNSTIFEKRSFLSLSFQGFLSTQMFSKIQKIPLPFHILPKNTIHVPGTQVPTDTTQTRLPPPPTPTPDQSWLNPNWTHPIIQHRAHSIGGPLGRNHLQPHLVTPQPS